jgi:F-type H+-transporting ATPase subunit epsilon
MIVDIYTPDKKIFSGEAVSITVPGTLGSFQILNSHAPLISTIDQGKLVIKSSNEQKEFFVKGGVVEVNNNKVIIILAEKQIS